MNLTRLSSVIVLRGKPNSGKTAILNSLCDAIINSPAVQVNPKEQEPSRTNKGDQRASAVYKHRKVAICTAGDDANCIVKAFRYAEKVNAEVLVMALSIHKKGYKTAELAFEGIVAHKQLTKLVDDSIETTYAPPKPKNYVDNVKVQALLSKVGSIRRRA